MSIKTMIAAALLTALFGTSAFAQNWSPEVRTWADPWAHDSRHAHHDGYARQHQDRSLRMESNDPVSPSYGVPCNVWGSTLILRSCD